MVFAFGYLCIGSPNRLPSFAMCLAFPSSDYYEDSVSCGSHRRPALLVILPQPSHVHDSGLYEIT